MTDREMQNQISEERRKGEYEKKCAVARTILTVVGIGVGIAIFGKFGTGDTAEQWGGIILWYCRKVGDGIADGVRLEPLVSLC